MEAVSQNRYEAPISPTGPGFKRGHVFRGKKTHLQRAPSYFPDPHCSWQPGPVPQMPLHVSKDQTQGSIWPTGAPQFYIEDRTGSEEAGPAGAVHLQKVRKESVSLIITGPAHLWALNPWEYILAKTYNPISVRVTLPPCHYTLSSLE